MTSVAKYADEKITLTADGRWLHGAVEITHERTRELFFKSIVTRGGKYFLAGDKSPVPIVVEDAPYFVRDWEDGKDGWGKVILSDGEQEALDPATLDVGNDNRLYCRVKGGRLRALFDRKVYYELTKGLTEQGGFYGLVRGGDFYPLRRKVDLNPEPVVAAPVKKAAPVARQPASKPALKPVPKEKKKAKKPAPKSTPAKSKKPAKKPTPKPLAKKTTKKPVKKAPKKKR